MEEEKELKKLYKHVGACRLCGKIYGFDIKCDDGLCPYHSRQQHQLRRQR